MRRTGVDHRQQVSPLRFALASVWLLVFASLLSAQVPNSKAKSVQELKAFFQQNCTRCHGRDGSARGADGKKLGGLDFTQAALDFRSLSGPASEREIRTMIRTIQKGIFFGLTMPSWKDRLSQDDATLMVREVLLKAEPGKNIEPGLATLREGRRTGEGPQIMGSGSPRR